MNSDTSPSNRKNLRKNSDGAKALNPATSADESDTGDRDKTDAGHLVDDSDRDVSQALATRNSNGLNKYDPTSGAKNEGSLSRNVPAPAQSSKFQVDRGRLPNGKIAPGFSGNPKGRKPKQPSNDSDHASELKRIAGRKIKVKDGGKERTITKGTAILEQWVNQAVKGDHRARRELIAYADKHGIDLFAGQHKRIQEAPAEVARSSSAFILSEEVLDCLSRETLDELTRVVKEREAEKKKGMH